MSLQDMPIRRKLIVIVLFTTVTTVLLMRALSLAYEFAVFRKTTLQHLATVGHVVAANSTGALAFSNPNDGSEILSALRTEPHIVAAALYDEHGALFARYPAGTPDSLFPIRPKQPGYHYDRLSLIAFEPVAEGDRSLGTLYIRLETGDIMRQWIQSSIGIALVVIALAVIVAYLISHALQKQISVPILALAETARAISDRRDYSVRASKRGEDELGLLTDAFNHMLAQIQTFNQTLEHRVEARTAELEVANKELEAFSYSVSHDLRAPLRAVDGFSQAVLEDYGSKLPAEGHRYLQIIRDGAQRMGVLIDDLLTFSRLSRMDLVRQKVQNRALVDEALRELNSQSDGREIDWRIAELPPCEGDPALLKQVWVNLLSNALKYTRKREAVRIEIGSRRENNQDVFFVRDNGTGFDMQYADKLFGVFQRLHRAEEFEGTGVGLAIVQRIVHRHGGRIWAKAAVDRGAEFSFTLGEETNHA